VNSPADASFVPLWRRLAAAAYDASIVVALWFVATALVMPLSHGAISREHPLAEFAYQSYLLAVGFLFFAGFWVRNGQTLGMLAWRVKVVQAGSGAKITWPQALKRYLGAAGAWLTLGIGIYTLYMATKQSGWQAVFSYWCAAICVLAFFKVFQRAMARSGGLTWYDRLSGTRLVHAPSFATISNPPSEKH
jgi:uncharacterized RDD family membrane protein YckC